MSDDKQWFKVELFVQGDSADITDDILTSLFPKKVGNYSITALEETPDAK